MLKLAANWQQSIPEATRKTYQEAMSDLTDDEIEAAFQRAIKTLSGDKIPRVADLRRMAGATGETKDGSATPNATAYSPIEESRYYGAILSFLDAYDKCDHACNPCDGTLQGTVPRGCCGYDRWQIHRAVAWYRQNGKTIPANVAQWMAKNGLLPARSV